MLPPDGRSEQPGQQRLFSPEKIEPEPKLLNPEWNSDGNGKKSVAVNGSTGFPLAVESLQKSASSTTSNSTSMPTASFFQRALAHVIDDFIFSWLTTGLLAVFGCGSLLVLNYLPKLVGAGFDSTDLELAIVGLGSLFCVLLMVAGWFYYAVLDSSEMQATFGKKILGLKVCDLSEKQFSLFHASSKLLVQPAIWLLILMAFASVVLVLMLPLTIRTVALVVWAVVTGLLFFTGIFGNLIFINRSGQTVNDFLSRRLVLNRTSQNNKTESTPRPKLLSIEKKTIAAVLTTVILFVIEICAISACNIDPQTCFVFPSGQHVLNTTGRVLRAKTDIDAGTRLDKNMYEASTMEPIFTPPYAIEPSANVSQALVYHDIKAGSLLNYSQVLTGAKEIGNIISIEPIKEDDTYISRCTVPSNPKKSAANFIQSLGGSPEDELATTSRSIQESLIECTKANQEKNFVAALSQSNDAIKLVMELGKKTNRVAAVKTNSLYKRLDGPLVKSQALLAKRDSGELPDGLRALLTDILLQRSIARAGLHQQAAAVIEQKNCLALLQSLHTNFADERVKSFGDIPSDDNSAATDGQESKDKTAQYLKMLGASDEKQYQNFARHINNVIKQSSNKN